MLLKYDFDINIESVVINLKRLVNQIYKLLPMREEQEYWQKPLETILEELAGLHRLLLPTQEPILTTLISKLEGLFTLTKDSDFELYRRTIFECLGLCNKIAEDLCRL